MDENKRKKLQGFNQYRHKTLQILKNLIFFCLDTKEAKNQGDIHRKNELKQLYIRIFCFHRLQR
jgi:hypothetical protein